MTRDKPAGADEIRGMIDDGWLVIALGAGVSRVSVLFGNEVVTEPLPDEPERAAFVSGPVVLAGLTDKDKPLVCDDVEELLKKRVTHTYSTFPWEQDHYVTCGQDENIEFRPLYEVENEAYSVYFDLKKTKGD